MSVHETLAGLLLAGIALYGFGLPMAWLAPAPAESPWAFRIAVAPAYAIAVGAVAGLGLSALGVRLNPGTLTVMIALVWAVAAWRTAGEWRIRSALRAALWPGATIVVSAVLWWLTLIGYGLYLPNRDFKNHAYFVAQVAWTGSADAALVMRPSPISEPDSTNFYPLGLHTLLGWILPSPSYPSVGVVAAAAVLVTSVSMPLAVMAMARRWAPASRDLARIAGFVAVGMIGLTSSFQIGSVTMLCAAALFAAGLAVVWLWVQEPSRSTSAAVGVCGVGLLLLHVAEAVGLAFVAFACLPRVWRRWPRGQRTGKPVIVGGVIAGGATAALLIWMLWRLSKLLERGLAWDLQPNEEGLPAALGVAVLQQPEGSPGIRALWILLAASGFWLAQRRGHSPFPLGVFMFALTLATVSGMAWTPLWLRALTAPWYGSASRVALMAMAPVALAGSYALVTLIKLRPERALRWGSALVGLAMVAVLLIQVTPIRRAGLQAALAGAGDTPVLARELMSRIPSGGTVLNLEGDGSANLFAFARVPVLSGLDSDDLVGGSLSGGEPLIYQLGRLSDSEVSRRMSDLDVQFIVLGTTSRYWGQEAGYVWQELLRQPELSMAIQGTDMVVLRYEARP